MEIRPSNQRYKMRPRIRPWFLGLVGAIIVLLPVVVPAQSPQDREARASTYLMQADELYSQGDYQKAAESYRQVAQVSANRMNLSRAYMGLSLCYFYLNDTANAKIFILKVLEIDPAKEVSSLFHPQTFVDLFNEVKKENEGKLGRGQPPVPLEEPRAVQPQPPAKPPSAPRERTVPEGHPPRSGGGHWEIGFHYSGWGINLVKGLFEETLSKKATNEIRDHVTDQLDSLYPGYLHRASYSNGLLFDSQGENYGAEIRFYPLGRRGSMSIGLSLEKTHVKLMMNGPVTQDYTDGSSATVESDAIVETSPVTTNLSFRWDFVPSSRVTPYFIFGLGLGPLDGEARYSYAGTYKRGSQQASITGDWLKTFDQLREDGEIELDLFIMIHAALGLKGEIVRGVLLKAEVGFWDGLVIRGGLAFRL